jgi:hypothetical protein
MSISSLTWGLRSRLPQQQQVVVCACTASYSSNAGMDAGQRRSQLKEKLDAGPELGQYQ